MCSAIIVRATPTAQARHNRDVKRTTIEAPDDIIDGLCQIAAEQQTSLASVVLDALTEKVRSHRKPRSIGAGDSGQTDISELIGEMPLALER
jgi:hypothetical protein